MNFFAAYKSSMIYGTLLGILAFAGTFYSLVLIKNRIQNNEEVIFIPEAVAWIAVTCLSGIGFFFMFIAAVSPYANDQLYRALTLQLQFEEIDFYVSQYQAAPRRDCNRARSTLQSSRYQALQNEPLLSTHHSTYSQSRRQSPTMLQAASSSGYAASGSGYAATTSGPTMLQAASNSGYAASGSGYAATTSGYAATVSSHAATTSGHAATTSGHAATTSGHAVSGSGHVVSSSGHAATNSVYKSSDFDYASSGSVHAASGSDHASSGSGHAESGSGHAESGSGHAESGSDHAASGFEHASSGSGHAATTTGHVATVFSRNLPRFKKLSPIKSTDQKLSRKESVVLIKFPRFQELNEDTKL